LLLVPSTQTASLVMDRWGSVGARAVGSADATGRLPDAGSLGCFDLKDSRRWSPPGIIDVVHPRGNRR
jgi:hypothetical protein